MFLEEEYDIKDNPAPPGNPQSKTIIEIIH